MKMLFKVLNETFEMKDRIETDEINCIVMDSREVQKGDLFFAINNGNNYIDDVLKKGAALVIADNYTGNDKRVIKVENTIKCMQELAKKYRKNLNVKVIAITGSNGKTTTKDMIHSVLSQKYVVYKTIGNLNNHIGVPFTILQLNEKCEIAVLEMGMSGFGEIDMLSDIAAPDIGVITNIGDSHLKFLKTRENVFKAKTELIKYILPENLVVFGDDPFLKELNGIKVGYGEKNNYQIKNFNDNDEGLSFEVANEKYHVSLNGKHNCINAAMAVSIGKKMKVSYIEIANGLKNLELTPMRFQKIERKNIIYINDAYNSSPISATFSLETFEKLYSDALKIVVLGDMLELGENEIEYHKEVLKKALSIHTDRIYLYGERMKKALEAIEENNEKITHFTQKEDIKNLIYKESKKTAVLLKGSRGMKLEDIINNN